MATIDILNQSGSVEWYTPAVYADVARNVLGGIDLDPASCAEANRTIKADIYYTLGEGTGCEATYYDGSARIWSDGAIQTDGLGEAWHGFRGSAGNALPAKVFLNPPYGYLTKGDYIPPCVKETDLCKRLLASFGKVSGAFVWSWYLLHEYRAGRVGSAILLVNNVPSEQWFHPLKYFPVCETDHRIKFNSPSAVGSAAAQSPDSSPGENGAGATRRDRDQGGLRSTRANILGQKAKPKKQKAAQPTKGSAFIFLPDIDHFRLPPGHPPCGGQGNDLLHYEWEVHPSIAAFIGEFSKFGFIYLPNALALQMRELHRSGKVLRAEGIAA
jgi:hypothetical protein